MVTGASTADLAIILVDTTRLDAEAAADIIVDRLLAVGGWDWSI